MNKKLILMLATLLLTILGVYMIYLGSTGRILPPVITGVGFILISIVFLVLKEKG